VSEDLRSNASPYSKVPFAWLLLGLFALLAASVFSIPLVLPRSPAIQEFIPLIDFSHTALVIHVNLSLLLWFLSFTVALWTLNTKPIKALDYSALSLACLGTLGIVIGPLVGTDKPLMNNYIPVLEHDWFHLSLALFGLGILLSAIKTVLRPISPAPFFESSPINRSVYASAWVCIAAFLALLASYQSLPKTISSPSYFEYLFWGAGHILQFSHTLLALLAWAWLLKISSDKRFNFSGRLAPLFIFSVMPVLSAPFIYYKYEVLSTEHHFVFTALVKYGGLSSLPIGLLITAWLLSNKKAKPEHRHYRASLYASLGLFAIGGVIGFLVKGGDTVIPVYYHGSIVGVTLAFMGLSYYFLPQFGYGKPDLRLAHWQPYIYGGGQFLHILGLAWSGGYGVQAKAAEAEQGLDQLPEIAGMVMMGLGGFISIIGGALFLWIVIKVLIAGKAAA